MSASPVPASSKARLADALAPMSSVSAIAETCWWWWAWPAPVRATGWPSWRDGCEETTSATAPSEIGQQSSSFRGEAIGLEASTSATVIGALSCASGWLAA